MKTSGTMNSATGHTSVSTRTGNFNDGLYDRAGARPDLDLNFARTKSLKDRVSKEELITFTRSSGNTGYGATYVDENGLVKVAAVNLLKYSEDFSRRVNDANSVSTTNPYSIGTTNNFIEEGSTTTAPDESTVPWYNFTGFIQQILTNQIAATYTVSVYLKTDIANGCVLEFRRPNGSGISDNISVTTEWKRFSLTATKSNTGNLKFLLDNRDAITASTVKIAVWGAQIEKGSVATEYIPTTNQASGAPRFTHDPVTKESKGLLIEQAATNFQLYSQSLGSWTEGTGASGSYDNSIQAPDGTYGSVYVKDNRSEIYQTWGTLPNNTNQVTISYFAKRNPNVSDNMITIEGFRYSNALGNLGFVNEFSIVSKTFHTHLDNTDSSLANPSHEYDRVSRRVISNQHFVEYPNGWVRVFATITLAASEGNFLSNSARLDVQGAEHYIWGVQVEAGAVGTSYIPTTTAEVTRSPDIAKIDGDNFGTYRANMLNAVSPNLILDNTGVTTSAVSVIENTQNMNLTPYSAVAPDGTFSAIKMEDNDLGSTSAVRQISYRIGQEIATDQGNGPLLANTTYTVSGYFKAGTASKAAFWLAGNDWNTTAPQQWINLSNGSLLGDTSVHAINNATATPAGNGWYRLSLTATTGSSITNDIKLRVNSVNPSGTSTQLNFSGKSGSFYMWGLQIEEGTSVTPYIPSTDTFTNRQSNATFVDGNGIVRRSMCNQLLYSEELDNSYWSKGQLSFTANAGIAPNGTQTADKAIPTTFLGGSHFIYRQINPGGALSIYAKADGYNHVSLVSQLTGQPAGANLAAGVSVNLTNGSVQDIKDGTAEVIDVGNGWYRITFSRTDNETQVYYLIQPHDGSEAPSHTNFYRRTYAGDGTSGVLLWGAMQTNDLTEAGDYYKTTDTISGPPRYSHDPDTLTPTGLYLEPEATNISAPNVFHFPEDVGVRIHYNTIAEQKAGQNTDGVVGPDGTAIGVGRMFFTGTETDPSTDAYVSARDNTPGAQVQTTFPNDNSYIYTSSVFIKPGLETEWKLRAHSTYASASAQGTGENIQCRYLLTGNGTVSGLDSDAIDATVQKYPNGWYRCSITYYRNNSAPVSTVQAVRIYADSYSNYNANSETGTIGWFWGPQVEEGTTATSYIPTSGATATRSADIFTSTATEVLDRANGTKPAFYTADGISYFVAWQNLPNTAGGNFSIFNNEGGSFFRNGTNSVGYYALYDGSTENTNFLTANDHTSTGNVGNKATYLFSTAYDPHKAAFRFKHNDFISYADGIPGTPDLTTPTMKKPTKMFIGGNSSGQSSLNGTLSRIAIWKTGLTNNKLDRITS